MKAQKTAKNSDSEEIKFHFTFMFSELLENCKNPPYLMGLNSIKCKTILYLYIVIYCQKTANAAFIWGFWGKDV